MDWLTKTEEVGSEADRGRRSTSVERAGVSSGFLTRTVHTVCSLKCWNRGIDVEVECVQAGYILSVDAYVQS